MYWSPDSKICAFWIAANGSTNGVLQAFDASTGKEVDPNLVRESIRILIIDKYKLRDQLKSDPGFDPFEWSLTPEARFAFIDHAHEDEH